MKEGACEKGGLKDLGVLTDYDSNVKYWGRVFKTIFNVPRVRLPGWRESWVNLYRSVRQPFEITYSSKQIIILERSRHQNHFCKQWNLKAVSPKECCGPSEDWQKLRGIIIRRIPCTPKPNYLSEMSLGVSQNHIKLNPLLAPPKWWNDSEQCLTLDSRTRNLQSLPIPNGQQLFVKHDW